MALGSCTQTSTGNWSFTWTSYSDQSSVATVRSWGQRRLSAPKSWIRALMFAGGVSSKPSVASPAHNKIETRL